MKNSFLDYYKLILQKVSFDKDLLTKEYRKALNMLSEEEAHQLNQWVDSQGLKNAFALKSGYLHGKQLRTDPINI